MVARGLASRFRYSLAVSMEALPENAPVLLRGEIDHCIREAALMGYSAIEIHLRDAIQIDGNAIALCCKQNGIGVSALATGLEASLNHCSMTDPDPKVRSHTLRQMKDHVDLARKLGCLVVVGMVRGNLKDDRSQSWEFFREALAELLEYAAKEQVTITLEAINQYINNYLNNVDETADFIRSFRTDNLTLHIDTHHMNIEDYSPVDSIIRNADTIGYVHVAEINRMYPGAGKMDFKAILQALRKIGYDGYISLECAPIPDGNTAAQKGLDYLKSIEPKVENA